MSTVTLRRYHLPNSAPLEGWAIIVLGSDGFFSAVSDYGDYAYLWRHHGCADFREFLLRAERDWDYFLGKLSPAKTYDGEETVRAIKRSILDARRSRRMSKSTAWREWELIEEHEVEEYEAGFTRWYDETDLGDAHELRRTSHDSDAVAFVRKTMVRLAEVLRTELEAERAAAAAGGAP